MEPGHARGASPRCRTPNRCQHAAPPTARTPPPLSGTGGTADSSAIATSQQPPRRDNFDALRLVAALCVLFSHQFALAGRYEPRFVGDHSFGNLGVLIFFSISGYLVAGSWRRDPHAGRFLLRRALRIVPGLAVAWLGVRAFVGAAGLAGFPGNPLSAQNGSLWTIPLEVECYLLFALTAVACPRPAPLFAAGTLIAWWLCGGQQPTSWLPYFGLFFAAGALLGETRGRLTLRARVALLASGCVLLCAGQTILGLALLVPQVAIAVGGRSWPWLRDAGRFGDLSYGIYLYAWPVQQTCVHVLGSDASYVALVLPSLLVTVGLALVSWRFVEQPALRWKPAPGGHNPITLRTCPMVSSRSRFTIT